MYYKKIPAEAVRVAVPAGVFILKYARETAGGRSSALLPDQMIEKTARRSLSLNTGELSKFFTCDHLVALKIFVNCFTEQYHPEGSSHYPGEKSASHVQTVCQRMAGHVPVHILQQARNGSCPV